MLQRYGVMLCYDVCGGLYAMALQRYVMLRRIVHMCIRVCSRGHVLLLMSSLRVSV
jgi:hypothetical protein